MSWRRILLLSLVFVALLAGVTWSLLQRSDAATLVVRRELQALFLPRADVTTTELDLGNGRLVVRGVRLDDPARSGTPLLTVERIDVDVAIGGSLALVDVHAITVDGFVLECGPTLPSAATLLTPRPAAGGTGGGRMPPLDLRRGRVRVSPRDGEPALELSDVNATVKPWPDAKSQLQLTGSARFSEFGCTLAWTGELDTKTGAGEVTLTATGGSLTTAAMQRVARLFGASPPAIEVAAELRTATLRVQLPETAAPGREPTYDVTAELAAAHLTGPELPTIIAGASLTLQASSKDGGSASVRLQQAAERGRLDVVARGTGLFGDEPQIDVRTHGKAIVIDQEIVKALQLFRTGRDIAAALQPTAGFADLELFLHNPHRRSGHAELDLDLRDVAMRFAGFGDGPNRAAFPLPMHKTRGRVRLRDDVVLIQDVHATIADGAGSGTLQLNGRIETRRPAGEDTTLDIKAQGVAFSPDLRTALTALLDDGGALYDKFAPQGNSQVDVQLRPRSELRGGWAVEIRPQDATMRWSGFPYRLDALRGTVKANADGAAFELDGKHGAGSLALRGFIPIGKNAGDGPGFSAAVDLQDLRLDDDLRTAVAVLAPDLDRPWQNAAPTGAISGHVKVWRPKPDDPLFHDARLELRHVDLQLPAAPWRATGLLGQVLIQGLGDSTRIDFDALRGKLENGTTPPANLAMLGNLVVGTGSREELSFVVRDLHLDKTLGDTLEQLGALGAGTWASLRPSGTVDLVCRHHRTATATEPLHLVVHLLDVRSDAPILPHPAEHMTGELTIARGELRFDDVRGTLGGAPVRCSAGRIASRPAPDGRTDIAFTVDCRGIRIDDGVANLFAGPLHRAVLQRQLLGTADLDGLRLQLTLPAGAAKHTPLETTLAGQLRLYDLDMTLGEGPDSTQVLGINGVVTLAESRVSDQGGELSGALRGLSLQAFGQPFEAIDAAFRANAREIAITAMTSRCHGGAVRSRNPEEGIRYTLPCPEAPLGELGANLLFEQVDIYTFLAHGGWQNPPYSGAASGEIALLELGGGNVIDCLGTGKIRIERADLGVVPLFTAIYAQLPPADRPRFERLEAEFMVKDRAVQLQKLSVQSKVLSAEGTGSMSFDGYVEIEMALRNLLGSSADPFVMPLIDYLTKNIVTFHLHGFLRDLHAEKRWVTESAPRRRAVVPMPPVTARPAAPDF